MRTIAKGLFPVELEVANNDDRAASPVCVATVGNRSCAGFSFGRALVESDARVNRAQSF
jgi:hypothetical protein